MMKRWLHSSLIGLASTSIVGGLSAVTQAQTIPAAPVPMYRLSGQPAVYWLDQAVWPHVLRHVPSPAVFRAMGGQWNQIVTANSFPWNGGNPIEAVRVVGHHKVYALNNGQCDWIPNPQVFAALGYHWGNIARVNYLPGPMGPTMTVSGPSPTPNPVSSPTPTPAPAPPTTADWIAMARPVYAPSSEQTYASWWQEQFGSVNAQGTIFVTSAGSNPQVILFTPPASAASPPQSVQALDQWFTWMNAHNAGIYYLTSAQAAGFPDEVNGAMVEQLPLTTLQQQDHGAYWTNQNTTSPDDAYTNHDLPF